MMEEEVIELERKGSSHLKKKKYQAFSFGLFLKAGEDARKTWETLIAPVLCGVWL